MASNEAQPVATSGRPAPTGIDDDLAALQMPGRAVLSTIWRRKLVVVAAVGACAVVGAVKAYFTAPVYESWSQIYVDAGGRNLISGDRMDGTLSPLQLSTQCEVIRSNHIVSLALAELQTDAVASALAGISLTELSIGDVKRSLSAGPSRTDETITVNYESSNPVESKLIVDAIVKAYVAFNTDQHKSTMLSVLNLLQAEKVKLEAELRQKTEAVVNFQKMTGMLSTDVERDDAATRRNLTDALAQANLNALDARANFETAARAVGEPEKVQAYIDSLPPGAMPMMLGNEAPQLAGELNGMQQRLRETQRVYGPNHPMVRDMRTRVDQLAMQYLSALLQTARQSEARVKSLTTSLSELQKSSLETATRSAELRRLESELRTTQTSVDSLGGRISSLKIAEEKPALTVTVLNGAEQGVKIRPNRPVIVFQGMLLGLLLGCGLALVDRRVRGAEEVSKLVNLPLLGTVPSMPAKRAARQRAKFVHTDPTSDAAEAYRSIRAALRFVLKHDDARTLLIASPTPGDGKTTLSSNLAIAMAQAGHRTLIVDGDLRQPSQHRIFEVPDEIGLTSVLQGEATLERAIQKTSVKNLSVLTAGPATISPADLFNGEVFADVMHTLAGQFDYVLIDSASVLAATDARMIGAIADATILTVRSGKSLRKSAVHACELLGAVGSKMVGVVVNDMTDAAARLEGFHTASSNHGGSYDERPHGTELAQVNGASGPKTKTPANLDPELFASARKRR